MNYDLATYSCADQLVESPKLTLIVGVAKHANMASWLIKLRACAIHFQYNTVSVVSWADSRQFESWYIQRYVWLSHS